MQPTIGQWHVVTSGPHRGKRGVIDLVDERPAGVFYRLTNRTEIVGRFTAAMLAPCDNPDADYVSQVTPETFQRAFDLLTRRQA